MMRESLQNDALRFQLCDFLYENKSVAICNGAIECIPALIIPHVRPLIQKVPIATTLYYN